MLAWPTASERQSLTFISESIRFLNRIDQTKHELFSLYECSISLINK